MLSFGLHFEPELARSAKTGVASAVQFGLIGLHLSRQRLDADFMRDVGANDIARCAAHIRCACVRACMRVHVCVWMRLRWRQWHCRCAVHEVDMYTCTNSMCECVFLCVSLGMSVWHSCVGTCV
jgi:hypothetical protein